MPKIRCDLRKEPKCKLDIGVCEWNNVTQKCSKRVNVTTTLKSVDATTSLKRVLPLNRFDVSSITNNTSVLKYTLEFLDKHNEDQAVICVNNERHLRSNHPFEWNTSCTILSIKISESLYSKSGRYIKFVTNANLVRQYNIISTIVNTRLDELQSQLVTIDSKEIQSAATKLTLGKIYFANDYCEKTSRTMRQEQFVYVKSNKTLHGSYGLVLYNACDLNNEDVFYKDLTAPFGIACKNCNFFLTDPSIMIKLGFTKFIPPDIDTIVHGLYKPNIDIATAYIGHDTSKELNISMNLMLQENEKIPYDITNRILILLEEFKKISSLSDLYDAPYVVYHGSSQEIHNTQTFVTTSFFSTTRNRAIASKYGNYMYVLTIPPKFPGINFHDDFLQILLPIGTYIKIDQVVDAVIFCHVIDEPFVFDQFIQIFKNPCTQHNTITFSDTSKMFTTFSQQPTKLVDDSSNGTFYYITNIGKDSYLIKDIVDHTFNIRAMSSDHQVFQRILNEMIAARIYSNVYNLETFDYTIFDKHKHRYSSVLTASLSMYMLVFKNNYKLKSKDFNDIENIATYKGFLIDCIIGNVNVLHEGNTCIHANNSVISSTPIRVEVGWCLVFSDQGMESKKFRKDIEPTTHNLITKHYYFKRMKLKSDVTYTPIEYLKTISPLQVRTRLLKIKSEFTELINMIEEKSFAKKYHELLDNIIETVIYRDAWYRKHGHDVLSNINRFDQGVITGGARRKQSIDTLSFAASPGQFSRLLVRHQQCTRRR